MDHFQNNQNKGRVKCEDRKTRLAFDFNQYTIEGISKMINNQKEESA
jgi:hypothetical protein